MGELLESGCKPCGLDHGAGIKSVETADGIRDVFDGALPDIRLELSHFLGSPAFPSFISDYEGHARSKERQRTLGRGPIPPRATSLFLVPEESAPGEPPPLARSTGKGTMGG